MPGPRSLVLVALVLGPALAAPVRAAAPAPPMSSPAAVHDGTRVEVPEHGLAVTLPAGWTWVIRPGDPDDPSGSGLFAEAPTGDARCLARTLGSPGPRDLSLDQWKQWMRGRWGERSIEPVVVSLPAGPALRHDGVVSHASVTAEWPEPAVPWSTDELAYASMTTYAILAADGTGAAMLECQRPAALGPPDDDWLSIAQTLEFLPAALPSQGPVASAQAGSTPAASPCVPFGQDPSGPGFLDCWKSARAHAVALVLATDPRFAGLPDYELLARKASSRFDMTLLVGSHFRVLSTDAELAQIGWSLYRTPGSWHIEVTLARDCAKPTAGTGPWPRPCAWRHSWYYRVQPDDTVTLLFDEGDPDEG
jgi:hypothetical protein